MTGVSDSALTELILDFAREMNELQKKYSALGNQPDAEFDIIHTAYRTEVKKLYARCLTPKKRNYYFALSTPPHFTGVNGQALMTVDRVRNRGIVIVLAREGWLDFQFSIVSRNESLLIDSYKQRYRSPDRTTVYQWQYGSF